MELIQGKVHRILSDDLVGLRHQRFIVDVLKGSREGKTILVAHNIDVAPRVPDLEIGEFITVKGDYEWNELGGLIHWTHKDPDQQREGGWVEWRGELYE